MSSPTTASCNGFDRVVNNIARNAPPEVLARLREIRQSYFKPSAKPSVKAPALAPAQFPPPGVTRL